jgi:hypothetical protein
MKTLIKLAIAAAIVNAAVHGAMAAWSYYQLKDAAQQIVLFGGTAPTAQLHDQITRRAVEYDVPLQPQDLAVTRDGPRTMAEGSYTQDVELFPNYRRPFRFTFKVDAMTPR